MANSFRRTPGDLCGGLTTHSKIFDLDQYRKKRRAPRNCRVLFLSNVESEFPLHPSYQLTKITNTSSLKNILTLSTHDLIVIDAGTSWIPAVRAVTQCQSKAHCPIILALRDNSLHASLPLLKEAYAAGITDAIPFPIPRDEFLEILDVMFQLSRTQNRLLP